MPLARFSQGLWEGLCTKGVIPLLDLCPWLYMCGLTGFLAPPSARTSNADMGSAVRAMSDPMVHRGPDDSGVWADAERGVALGHRRLSILDLSPEGHQPMASPSGRYVTVYNGEIYNFAALRRELEGRGMSFRGHSDTEVVLAAFEVWGVEATLRRLVGMFAFAIWDREALTLTLARDRFGEKPLYYAYARGHVLFGSELKALRAHPAWDRPISRDALAAYLRFNYVPGPHAIYEDAFKLPPGHILTLRPDSLHERPEPVPFWTLRDEAAAVVPPTSDAEAKQRLRALLDEAVAGQMVADVPVGAFLSGGVDSSTVVALMQAQSDRPVRTFTIGMHDEARNEAVFARAVAEHLKTDHTELYVHPDDALAVVPLLPHLYDEPFADSSQIPTYLVSQLARQHVTVSLSGDGGDELFAGYGRYAVAPRYARAARAVPQALGRMLAAAALRAEGAAPPAALRRLGQVQRLGEAVALGGVRGFHRSLLSGWASPSRLVPGSREAASAFDRPALASGLADAATAMMHLDLHGYLPDDLLVKVDRAAMGVSLETRVPLLDHRVAAFAFSLPHALKVRDGQTKWLLRQVLYDLVPRALIERPKMGFGLPFDAWLRGPLRAWAEDLLAPDRLAEGGLLNPAPISALWNAHLTTPHDFSYQVWGVLMFQLWRSHQLS